MEHLSVIMNNCRPVSKHHKELIILTFILLVVYLFIGYRNCKAITKQMPYSLQPSLVVICCEMPDLTFATCYSHQQS